MLRVADTGAGIHPDLLPRIFDLFVQGHTSLHRREAGLGVGLTLTRRLVDLHHGRIEAHSDGPGRGSVFTAHFPTIAPPGEAPDGRVAVVGHRGARRRVLIVEDHDDARQMLRHLLESLGHEVHEAADGISGLDRALSLAPDAVVVSGTGTGSGGRGTAGEVRGRPLTAAAKSPGWLGTNSIVSSSAVMAYVELPTCLIRHSWVAHSPISVPPADSLMWSSPSSTRTGTSWSERVTTPS